MATSPDATGFTTKDSGAREEFSTGARRDVQIGKGRYDLIPPQFLKNLALELEKLGEDRVVLLGLSLIPMRSLLRLAGLYGRGAVKYGPSNWMKGIPLSRTYNSLLRHVNNYKEMLADEDHLSAIAWNAWTIMETEAMVLEGKLPNSLLDLGPSTVEGLWRWIDKILNGDPAEPVKLTEIAQKTEGPTGEG